MEYYKSKFQTRICKNDPAHRNKHTGVPCQRLSRGRAHGPSAAWQNDPGQSGAIAQQPIQRSAVVCFDAHTRVHRKSTVLVAKHLSGVTTLQQAQTHEGAQDAAAQICLYLRHGGLIDSTCRVEDDARW